MAAEEANVELFNIFLDQPQSAVNAKVSHCICNQGNSLTHTHTHCTLFNVRLCTFQTFSGNTALHIVSSLQNHKRQVEAVKLLMKIGAVPGARNFENELPCQLVPRGPTGEKVILIPSNKGNNRLFVY